MYIIDGNNVAGSSLDLELGTRGTEAYITQLVERWAATRRHEVILVFDGHRQHTGQRIGSNLQIRYPSDMNRTNDADAVIVEIVRDNAHPANIVVVTSDKDLRAEVRALGVRVVVESREFLRELQEPQRHEPRDNTKPEHDLSDREIEEWTRYFGIDPKDKAKLGSPTPKKLK